MSKVNQIQPNCQLAPKQHGQLKNFASKQSFGAEVPEFTLPSGLQKNITKAVEAKITKKLGFIGRVHQFLADTQGEVQNQLVNALFTTTLAPFWIAFNPFTKDKSKEDKYYLSLRQPVSAIIAVTGGLAMTLGLNDYMAARYHDGSHKGIDLRPAPNKDYLKRMFKKANGIIRPLVWPFAKEEQLEAFGKYNEEIKTQRLNLFTRLLSENPEELLKERGKLQEGQTLKVPNLGTEEELSSYLEHNNLHKRTFRDFMKERFGFKFYEDGSTKPYNLEKKLREIKAMDFLKEFGLIEEGKVVEDELRKTLAIYQQERNVPSLRHDILNGSGTFKKDGPMLIQEITGKIASRVTQMTVGEDIDRASTVSLGHLFHQLGYYEKEGSKKTLQDLLDEPMAKVMQELGGHFRGKLKGFDSKANLASFAKNFIKITSKRLDKHASNYMKYGGILFNLPMTAITCTILNWAYPKFVKKFFPSLVPKDHDPKAEKGGHK